MHARPRMIPEKLSFNCHQHHVMRRPIFPSKKMTAKKSNMLNHILVSKER